MVVFTCNHCGESLQKPKVEKHYAFQCRRPKSLTCVDCFKDFKLEEYVVHTKCITEEERYSAKGSIPGGIVKKGEVKQESWMEMIKKITTEQTDIKVPVRNLLNNIANFSNVPRKKQKFINFIKSSTGGRVNFNDIEEAWDIIEKYKAKQTTNGTVNGKPATNGETKENNKNKRKTNDSEEIPNKKSKTEEAENNAESSDIFSFKGKIIEILQEKGSISLRKLQKKVLNAYKTEMNIDEVSESTIKKYNKKLKKVPNVIIKDDIVSLEKNL